MLCRRLTGQFSRLSFLNSTLLPSTSAALVCRPSSSFNGVTFDPHIRHLDEFDVALPPAMTDDRLVNRGDFFGVRPSVEVQKISTPEIAVGKLRESLTSNQRVTADQFLSTVLLPIEAKNEAFVSALRAAPDSLLPFLIQCCGLGMSDVPDANRLIILERFLRAVNEIDVKMTVKSFTAIMDVWLQNECDFNVDEVLNKVEIELKLEPDVEFFNKLLWKLAHDVNIAKINDYLNKMAQRGILPNVDSGLAQIYCSALRGHFQNCTSLIERIVKKHGESHKIACLSTEIRGTAAGKHMDRLRKLLRQSVVIRDHGSPLVAHHRPLNMAKEMRSRYMLNLDYDTLFDVVWQLSKRSSYGDGKEFVTLTTEILERAQRTKGFFKRLFREAERHLVHGYYYTAAIMAGDMARVQEMLKTQRKSLYRNHIISKICNQMIRQRLSEDVIWDVSNRIITSYGPDYRFFDDLAFSILSFKDYRFDERFVMFSKFADVIDPDRTRIHLILPILVRCPDLVARQSILYQCSKIGYTNFADLDTRMVVQLFYRPMLESFERKRDMTDYERLGRVSRVMESFGVPKGQSWVILRDYAKLISDGDALDLPVTRANFLTWLTEEYHTIYTEKMVEKMERDAKYTHEGFMRLLGQGDVERVHKFITNRGGLPSETKLADVIDRLLDLYLNRANWGYVKKLLGLFSTMTIEEDDKFIDLTNDFAFGSGDRKDDAESSDQESPVKNYHLLRILDRFYSEKKDFPALIEFVYELKRLFPYSVSTHDTFFKSVRAYDQLFRNILLRDLPATPDSETVASTQEKVNHAIDLVTLLIKLDLMMLHGNEVLTLNFVERIFYSLGWNIAVDTWLKFQSSLYCSNGLFALMNISVREDDKTKVQFLLHRAKNFIASSRVNAYLAAAYVNLRRGTYLADAERIFENKDDPLNVSDCFAVFRLLQAKGRHRSAYEFCKLVLKHTTLRSDDRAKQLFLSNCVWLFEASGSGHLALDFYELFKQYDIHFSLAQMERIQKVFESQKSVITKWLISDKTRVLNPPQNSAQEGYLTRMNDFFDDLMILRSGGTLARPSRASTPILKDEEEIDELVDENDDDDAVNPPEIFAEPEIAQSVEIETRLKNC